MRGPGVAPRVSNHHREEPRVARRVEPWPPYRPGRVPLGRAEIAFPYDPFVRLAATLDPVFELPVSLGQLRYDLIRPASGITSEGGGLQNDAAAELEFMHRFTRRNRRGWGMHAISFRPRCLGQDGTKSVPVATMNEDQAPSWRLG